MDDLISRQAAIEALNKLKIYRPLDSDRYVISDCLNKIVNLPSAQPEVLACGSGELNVQPEPHWIPCSKRLPERGEDVLVTRDYDGREDNNKSCRYVEVASCYGEDEDITWNSFSDEYKMHPKNHHVIAWMPLPEPYKERWER